MSIKLVQLALRPTKSKSCKYHNILHKYIILERKHMNKKLFLLIALSMAGNSYAASELTHTEELLLELYQNQRQDLKEYSLEMVQSANSIQLSSSRLDNLVQHLDHHIHKSHRYKTALYCILSATAGAVVHKAFADYSAQKPDSWIGKIGSVWGIFNVIRKTPAVTETTAAVVATETAATPTPAPELNSTN